MPEQCRFVLRWAMTPDLTVVCNEDAVLDGDWCQLHAEWMFGWEEDGQCAG